MILSLAKSDVTLTLGDADLVDLMLGKLNPQKAFFQGKLKIQVWTSMAGNAYSLLIGEGSLYG